MRPKSKRPSQIKRHSKVCGLHFAGGEPKSLFYPPIFLSHTQDKQIIKTNFTNVMNLYTTNVKNRMRIAKERFMRLAICQALFAENEDDFYGDEVIEIYDDEIEDGNGLKERNL
ncbi:hypothetical protein HAX54_041327 [Datura stramonium]|uniref:Uncharacterized protein n=1 Tax=Datura stramonium TaxID=4076 RepID=A0ABS8VNY5_DATST|nr:hypothetical protein [Datura stramonium]